MSLALNHAKLIDMKQAEQFILDHNHFLLIGHEHPDGDDVGAICGLHDALLSLGKTADMVLPDPVPRAFTLVKASSLIRTTLSENASYDAMIFTDLGNLARGGHFDFPDVPSLCIDHHRTNEKYTDYLYLKWKYAATCEMLAEMFFDMNVKLSQDACNALYMGIGTDSGFFKFSCTSPHTLYTAGKLVELGADPSYISNHLDAKTEEAMKCYKLVADTVHSYDHGKIVVANMSKEAMDLDGENSDYYASIPRSLMGAEVALLLKYEGPEETRVSLRSVNHANVSEIASRFGGGGHWKASGCTIKKSMEEAEKDLVEAAEDELKKEAETHK